LQPAGKATSGHFSVDVWPRSSKEVYPGLLRSFKEWLKCENAFCSIYSRFPFKKRPVDVEGYAVVAERLDFLEDVKPQVGYWKSANSVSLMSSTDNAELIVSHNFEGKRKKTYR
jgi:hypothetical protein